jgi:hypothetical protein
MQFGLLNIEQRHNHHGLQSVALARRRERIARQRVAGGCCAAQIENAAVRTLRRAGSETDRFVIAN